ncbi:MAG: hypothetical protein HY904_19720 [Deltaproteobacteria bacterium]|nr:hypothetical protein [Deltaproteobacteria bacterium]
MADFVVDVEVARPRAEVHRWWTGFPDAYDATDPREQPHRIRVLKREGPRIDLHTWWRMPLGVELLIPETVHLQDEGRFHIDVALPLALAQVDRFTLTEKDGRTHVHIEFDVRPRGAAGRLTRPFYLAYMRATFPRSFRTAARLCERDAPHLGA